MYSTEHYTLTATINRTEDGTYVPKHVLDSKLYLLGIVLCDTNIINKTGADKSLAL
jgi:hypothetical protein